MPKRSPERMVVGMNIVRSRSPIRLLRGWRSTVFRRLCIFANVNNTTLKGYCVWSRSRRHSPTDSAARGGDFTTYGDVTEIESVHGFQYQSFVAVTAVGVRVC